MEGRKEPEGSDLYNRSKRMRNKRKQSNNNNSQRSFGDLPPEVAQHYLSQMTGAAAAAWDSQMLGGSGSSGNGNSSGGSQSKSGSAAGSGGVAFGPSRPPNAGGASGGGGSGASLSFGSLDLAALAQSGSFEFSSAVAAAAAKSDASASGAGPQCSEAEMKALMAMFVEIMGMNMDNSNNATSSSSSSSTKSASKQSMAQAARNFLQANSSAAAAAAATTSNTNTASSSSSSNNPFPVFMFGNSGNGGNAGAAAAANSMPTPPGGWPSTSAAAAAAAAFARINGFTDTNYYDQDTEYEDDDDEDDDSLPELHGPSSSTSKTKSTGLVDPSPLFKDGGGKGNNRQQVGNNNSHDNDVNNGFSPAALAALEQEEIDDALHQEEQQRKAAKKREKKQRKKERAKKEAAAKAAQAAQKKREKLISSWRSRVVSACQANEVPKLESLLGESPFLKLNNSNKGDENVDDSKEEQQQTQNKCLESLLSNCIAKSRQQAETGFEGRQKLTDFILTTNMSLIFMNGRNGRTAIHTACFSGDVHFVNLVLVKAAAASAADDTLPESYLNIHCEDSGWTPLHYAVVSGSLNVFEIMLASGCDIQKQTNEKTCRVSGNGVTARELAEIIRSGKHDTLLETQGDALQEVTDGFLNNSPERSRFLRILEKIDDRLTDVEKNGYSPPTDPSITGSVNVNNSTDETNKDATLRRATSSISDDAATKKKKQKKKKKKAQQQQQAESTASKTIAAPEPTQTKDEDPMISALLGMGFNMDQISAAAKACGGYHRATADDLVMWIFSQQDGGTPANDTPPPSQNSTTTNSAPPAHEEFTDSQKPEPKQQQQQSDPRAAAAAQAQKAAVKREEEARLAAQKLAAKKEEQRRRNREWNNREQARQKEEADAKLAQEVERRARVEAQRAMMERMAVQQQQQQQQVHGAPPPGMVGVPQQISYSANAPPMGVNVTGMNRAPPMGGPTHILQNTGEMRSLGGAYAPGSHPQNKPQMPVHGHPPAAYAMPPHQPEYSQMPNMPSPNLGMESAPMMNAPAYNESYDQPPMNMPGIHGEMQPPATVEVNSFDYPGLGKDDGTVSSMGSGRQRDSRGAPKMYQNRGGPSTPKGMRGANASSSTPPPGFVPTPSTSSSSVPVTVPAQPAEEESGAPNPLGEIRATAKAFVPTHFVPAPAPAAPAAVTVPAPAPTTSDILSESSPSDPPSWMGGLTNMDQPSAEGGASSILDAPTSLLPGTAPFATSSSMGLTEETAVSGTVPALPDAPEATSSILDQLGVGGVATSTSGGGLWGESETNSSGAAFTGVPSLSFGEGTLSIGSQPGARTFGTMGGLFDGEENKDINNANTWGSGAGGGDAGLGSIW